MGYRIKKNLKILIFILINLIVSCKTDSSDDLQKYLKKLKLKNKNINSYIEIRNINDFYRIEDDLSANYILMDDINMSDFSFENFYKNLNKKDSNAVFKGKFDGNGHTIENLNISLKQNIENEEKLLDENDLIDISSNIVTSDNMGIFRNIGKNAVFENVIFQNVVMVGNNNVGIITSVNRGKIKNIFIKGSLRGITNVGFVASENYGIIENILLDLNINAISQIGGVVYSNEGGLIKNTRLTGTIIGSRNIGGIACENKLSGIIKNSQVSLDIIANSNIGGVVNINNGQIINSKVFSNISGKDNLGGVVNINYNKITYSNVSKTSITGKKFLGGIAAINNNLIEKSSFSGDIEGTEDLGGIASENGGLILHSYSLGSIQGSNYIGGFVGLEDYDLIKKKIGKINDSYSGISIHAQKISHRNYMDRVNEVYIDKFIGKLGSIKIKQDINKLDNSTVKYLFENVYIFDNDTRDTKYRGVVKFFQKGSIPDNFDKNIWKIDKEKSVPIVIPLN